MEGAGTEPSRVLVYHIGSLGDSLIVLPALWALRAHWPRARFFLLTKRTPLGHVVVAEDVLVGTGVFEGVLSYPGSRHGDDTLTQRWQQLRLLMRLRASRFDVVVYLAPSERQPAQVRRDRQLFALAGIRRQIGLSDFPSPPPRDTHPLPTLPSEAEVLVRRLAAAGIATPPLGQMRRDCAVSKAEEAELGAWLALQHPAGHSNTVGPASDGRRWLALAPGTNMPSKQWPLERFVAVARVLVKEQGLWPVVFGGQEDRLAGEQLVAELGVGWVAAGALSVRVAAAAMRRVALYVGNDTGTMHLAASEGVRCIVPFAARDFPGKWHPIGVGHRIIRRRPACEGCMLERCEERRMQCLLDIDADELLAAARSLRPVGVHTPTQFSE